MRIRIGFLAIGLLLTCSAARAQSTTGPTTNPSSVNQLPNVVVTSDLDLAREHLETAQGFVGPTSSRQDYAWLRVQRALVNARTGDSAGAIDEASTTFSGIRPSFPELATSLANLGRVGVIYHKSIEQLLVVLPPLFAAITTAAGGGPQDEGAKLDFKLDLNDPPPCAVGFLPPPLMRTPAMSTARLAIPWAQRPKFRLSPLGRRCPRAGGRRLRRGSLPSR